MGKLRADLVERVHMHPRTTAQWPLTTSPHAVASAQLFVPYVQIDPAPWLGVQSSHAERAVAPRSMGPGADLIGLASRPPPMLHLGVRVCLSSFSFLFLFYSLLLSGSNCF